MLAFLVLTAVTFSLFGFIIGIWADGFEKLQMIPMLVVTPLTFLGGSFYSVNMLPSGWRTVTLLNPVVYLISGFRWSFYEIADVSVGLSVGMTLALPRRLHGRGVVDLQDRLPAEELTRSHKRADPSPRNDRSDSPIAAETGRCRVVAAAAIATAIAAIRNAEHAFDGAHRAADAGADRATHHAADRAALRGCLPAEPSCAPRDDALSIPELRHRQQREASAATARRSFAADQPQGGV